MTRITDHLPDLRPLMHNAFNHARTFVAEIPWEITALTIAGIALLIFAPQFAAPCFCLVGAALLTHITIICIDKINPDLLQGVKEQLARFERKFPKTEYIALVVAVVVFIFLPVVGLILTAATGIYKGIIMGEVISKNKADKLKNIRAQYNLNAAQHLV